MMIPILIPLGSGSKCDNDELRILLRSIEQNAGDVGEIYIISTKAPKWLRNVTVVPIGDPYPYNKDANLHHKILKTIEQYDLDDFVFCSDDNVFVKPISLNHLPRLFNIKGREKFDTDRTWHKRMRQTFKFMDSVTFTRQDHHYDVHAPQLFHGKNLLEKMKLVDYVSQPGLCIYSTWRVVTEDWKNCEQQGLWKETAESVNEVGMLFFDKTFLGYNDAGFVDGGLRRRLLERFPNKSRYER